MKERKFLLATEMALSAFSRLKGTAKAPFVRFKDNLVSMKAHNKDITSLRLLGDKNIVVSASKDKCMKVAFFTNFPSSGSLQPPGISIRQILMHANEDSP